MKKTANTISLATDDLLDVLSLIKPALSSREYIPIFGHYLFELFTISGYNDAIGITVNYKTDISGGIKGDVLFPWLSTKKGGSLSVSSDDGKSEFKVGKSTLKTPCLDKASFIHQIPAQAENVEEYPLDDAFISGIKTCLLNVDNNTAQEMSGVVMSIKGKSIYLYSTNGMNITKVTLSNARQSPDNSVVLSRDLARAMVKIYESDSVEKMSLFVDDKSVVVDFSGKYDGVLYAKLSSTAVLDFDSEIKSNLKGIDLHSVPIKQDIIDMIGQVKNIFGPKDDNLKGCTISVDKNSLRVETVGVTSTVDEVNLEESYDPSSANIDLYSFHAALEVSKEFTICDNLTVFNGTNLLILQAHLSN